MFISAFHSIRTNLSLQFKRLSFPISLSYSAPNSRRNIMTDTKRKISIIGSGNWGSAIARIIAQNTVLHPDLFESEVRMWVFEELIGGEKLTDIINTRHENVKYLPGRSLGDNVLAVPDILEASKEADILVFVVPHQFLYKTINPLKGHLKPGAVGISLIKGFHFIPSTNQSNSSGKGNNNLTLISQFINSELNIPVSVLMGANLAHEVADNKFCETTIGLAANSPNELSTIYKNLFQTPNFRVVVVRDSNTVEMCGALKNVVACGAGFVDGMGDAGGDNTKSAIIRLGLMEMIKFAQLFYHPSLLATFFESCGIADLITTCYGGRNRRVSQAFALAQGEKTIQDLEAEMLQGQRLQGPETAAEVNAMLKSKGLEDQFPLFTAVHKICTQQIQPCAFLDELRNHPEHVVDKFEDIEIP